MADGAMVRVERDAGADGVVHVVLDRPAALNAISTELATQLATRSPASPPTTRHVPSSCARAACGPSAWGRT